MNLEVVNIQIDGEYVNEVIWVKSGETSIHTGMSLTTPLNLKVDEYSLENPGETSIITVKTDKNVYKQIELIRCTPGCECDIFDINIDDENDKFLPYEGGTISFTYSLKDEFKNTCDIKTITCYTKSNFVSVYKDSSNNKFIATFEENYVSKRKARIIFSYAGINCQVFTISQAAKVESCNQRIRIAAQNGEKEVECNGGSVQFVIKEIPVPSCNEKITVSAEGGVTTVSCEGGVRVQFTHGEPPSPEPPKPINPCNSAITITTTAEKIKQAGETILFETTCNFFLDNIDVLSWVSKPHVKLCNYSVCGDIDESTITASCDGDFISKLEVDTDEKAVYGDVLVNSGGRRTANLTVTFGNITTVTEEITQGSRRSGVRPDPEDADVINLLNQFNDVISDYKQRTGKSYIKEIGFITTPYTFENLSYAYNYANSNVWKKTSLFNKSTYGEIFDYHGNNSQYEETSRNAMLAWLMAMQLSEILADSGKTTNIQTELFKKAYEIGGGRSVPLYGNYTIAGDVTIARLIASAVYAITRSELSFEEVDFMRMDVTGSYTPIDYNDSISNFIPDIYATCDGSADSRNNLRYTVDLNQIFPSSPGPFSKNYNSGGFLCYDNQVGPRTYPQEQPAELFYTNANDNSYENWYLNNYRVDVEIDRIATINYNLTSVNDKFKRTVQAVSDDSESVIHMFANKTYYKYNANKPWGSFIPGTPSDNMGSFNGVFNMDVTGKDLSSSINVGSNRTALGNFFSTVRDLGGRERMTILDRQYGRRRPAQGESDFVMRNGSMYYTSIARCLCDNAYPNNGQSYCPNECSCTNLNWLDDGSIELLNGSGTKYDESNNAISYYIDSNGDGRYENGELYYKSNNTATQVALNYCPGVHASSYPSGHAAGMWTAALFLMQMLPFNYEKIFKAAYDFTVSRTIVRAHWNSDIIYGKLSSTTYMPIINALRQTTDINFRDLYKQTKNIIDNV